MNRKDKLYYDLIEAYRNHSCNDTLIDTYVNKVLKLVKDYLNFDNLKDQLERLEKLEEAIKILKDNLFVYENGDYRLSVNGSHHYQELNKQEFELLKEVFGNV